MYFDHNATSPLSAVARDAWLAAAERYPANPSSPHRLGARAETALNEARSTVAEWLNCSPWQIVWTSGATEANNALFFHASTDTSGEAWVSAIEHPSVLQPAKRWFRGRLRLIPATRDGVVDLNWLEEQLKNQNPALVAVMAANNETGVLQPWPEIARLCRERQIPYACDAAQWIGKLPAAGLGECNYVTGCAHKFGGPVGVGFIKTSEEFTPLLVGGEQEDGRRAGTQNLPGILSMVAAWHHREQQLAVGEGDLRRKWRNRFIENISKNIPGVEILGTQSDRLWNTVTALMPPSADCRRRWVVALDKIGFAVSTGSACASGREKPSHVVTAMGFEPSKSDRMLRFSSGWETTFQDWKDLEQALRETASRLASPLSRS